MPFKEKHGFLYMILTTPIRLYKKDPVLFISSTLGAITGTISVILHFTR